MKSRLYVSAALLAVVCATQTVTWGAENAPSATVPEAKAPVATTEEQTAAALKAAQDQLEKEAAEGSATALQRLGDMYHDGDGGVKKDYAKAIEWYKQEAALDDSHPGSGALGMIALGEMYEKGRGVEADKAQSEEWFKKARASGKVGADKGDSMAMTALAYCMAQGKGAADGKAQPVEAWAWAIKAAQSPNPWAYELIASFYAQGVGVKPDAAIALSYLFKAAQMGVSRDMVAVSQSFATGTGVKKDDEAAVNWIRRAAVGRGCSEAMGVLGRYYHEGIGMERSDLTAKEWFAKAIDRGDEKALGYMGDTFVAPGVNPRDAVTAMSWFEKGTAAKDAYSMFRLAYLLTYDPDVTSNITRATELLTQASAMGFADATSGMGDLYRSGKLRGTLADAIAWYRKAAEAGSLAGMRNLGETLMIQADNANRYSAADDDRPMMTEAYNWVKKAADAGDMEAVADVGDAYLRGKGVTASASTAATWYLKAAEAGNVRAMRALGQIYLNNTMLADYVEARKWFEKGVALGDAACMSGLAELYDNALGVREDNNRALDLYMRAARGGDGGGYRGMAQYIAAAGDYRQAAAYYQEAVRLGDMRAMEALGRMYELGQGVEKNMARAMQLYRDAQNMGSLSAANWVFSHTDFSGNSTATTSGPALPQNLRGLMRGGGPARGGFGGPGGGAGRGGPGGGAGGGAGGGRGFGPGGGAGGGM
jgi:uncharacterized protein